MSQTSYSQTGAIGFHGQIADTMEASDIVSYSAEAAIPFGSFVTLGTNKERQVLAVSTSVGQGALAIGVATASHTVEQTSAGVAQYAATQTVSTMKRGRVYLTTDDAVVAGAVANLKLSSGKVTDEAVAAGIEAFTQFKARFITGTTAAGLAIVEINPV